MSLRSDGFIPTIELKAIPSSDFGLTDQILPQRA